MNSCSARTVDRVVIAAAADRSYAMPLAVMLRSAADRVGAGVTLVAYVVDDGLSPADRDRVISSLPKQVELHWISRSQDQFRSLPNWGRMSLTTYHKLTLGEWLPAEIDKAIWLDADLLVLADLTALWQLDLKGFIALAARDRRVSLVSSRFGVSAYKALGLPPETHYFNAGVMLLDVARWRKAEVTRRALDYLRRYGQGVFFWDQEALNAVLPSECGPLDGRWNFTPALVGLTSQPPGAVEAEGKPWIIHFTGNLKPWNYPSSSSHHSCYYECLDQTAWRGWRPPAGWRGRLLAAYEFSRVRRYLYPVEQMHMQLTRFLTRR